MDHVSLRVELGERSYPILIGRGILRDRGLVSRHVAGAAVGIVTNELVAPLYLEPLRAALADRIAFVEVLPDGEQYKTLATLGRIYDTLIGARFGRDGMLVALGGGVVGDITGFAAATWQRGVDFVQVPTTLLALVDSSVGGKTGVNHPRGKNMIGAFHQPRGVLADVDTLETLPAREYAAGLAEVIKYGLIGDEDFYRWIERNATRLAARDPAALIEAVGRSCANKARVVAADERESGLRALLNFGHTFGHAIETATGYSRLLHGEAVAIGMAMAARMSRQLGWIPATDVDELCGLLERLGLPVAPPPGLDPRELAELMAGDKKSLGGRLRLVLLRRIGAAVVTAEFPAPLLRSVLEECCATEPLPG